MTTTLFQPIGNRARWRIVYEDLLRPAKVEQVVTYGEFGAALAIDSADRPKIRQAIRRAVRELEEADLRTVDAVPNVGYRIVKPEEHLMLARRQQRRSSRALVRGKSKVVNVDLSGVDPETRHAFEVVARAFTLQMDFNRRFDVRQARLESAVMEMAEKTKRTDDEVAELKARLANLEAEAAHA